MPNQTVFQLLDYFDRACILYSGDGEIQYCHYFDSNNEKYYYFNIYSKSIISPMNKRTAISYVLVRDNKTCETFGLAIVGFKLYDIGVVVGPYHLANSGEGFVDYFNKPGFKPYKRFNMNDDAEQLKKSDKPLYDFLSCFDPNQKSDTAKLTWLDESEQLPFNPSLDDIIPRGYNLFYPVFQPRPLLDLKIDLKEEEKKLMELLKLPETNVSWEDMSFRKLFETIYSHACFKQKGTINIHTFLAKLPTMENYSCSTIYVERPTKSQFFDKHDAFYYKDYGLLVSDTEISDVLTCTALVSKPNSLVEVMKIENGYVTEKAYINKSMTINELLAVTSTKYLLLRDLVIAISDFLNNPSSKIIITFNITPDDITLDYIGGN